MIKVLNIKTKFLIIFSAYYFFHLTVLFNFNYAKDSALVTLGRLIIIPILSFIFYVTYKNTIKDPVLNIIFSSALGLVTHFSVIIISLITILLTINNSNTFLSFLYLAIPGIAALIPFIYIQFFKKYDSVNHP
jgi:hypothetical protein